MMYLYVDVIGLQSWQSDVPPDETQLQQVTDTDLCVFRPSEDVPGRMEELNVDGEWKEVPFQRK